MLLPLLLQTQFTIYRQDYIKMPPNRPRQRKRPFTLATFAGIFSLILPASTMIRLYLSHNTFFPMLTTFVVSSIAFLTYGYDKMQARNMQWRVKEVTLHMLALVGGWPGALAGMHYFQHKTRKTSFQVVFWGIVVVWEGIWWGIWNRGIRIA